MEETKKAGSMTRERMQAYFDSFNTEGATKTFNEYYTDDIVFKTPWGKEFSGRQNVLDYMNNVAHYKDKIKETMTAKTILIDGEGVAVEIETVMEAFEDVPDFHMGGSFKKGDKVKWVLSAFYTIRNGKISSVHIYVVADPWLRKWMG
jgi:ketosteroid isomerase-like protein